MTYTQPETRIFVETPLESHADPDLDLALNQKQGYLLRPEPPGMEIVHATHYAYTQPETRIFVET